MQNDKRRLITRRDAVIFAAVFVLAVAAYFITRPQAAAGAAAEIIVDGAVVSTVSLGRDQVFPVPGREEVILEVRDGAIRFIESSCPDKICIKTGDLRYGGESAACLPNRVIVRVVAEDGADVVIR